MPAPADLSKCAKCGRPVPPSNRPEFASWVVVKDGGRVAGMLCPSCQADADADAAAGDG